MKVSESKALKLFKKEIGQANHMLITIMVGLDEIISHDVNVKPEFHTSWNPHSKEESANRSKYYAKKSTLAWLVDCIDMYFRLINKGPSLISDPTFKMALDKDQNSRSIYRRVQLIPEFLHINSTELALVDLLICWRNRLTHYDADNDITEDHRELLIKKANEISATYCGLDIQSTLRSFDTNEVPTFKEVTSFVRASILFITEFDHLLLTRLGQKELADRVLIHYFSESTDKRLNNIFSKVPTIAEKSIRQILSQYGFSTDFSDKDDICDFCSTISTITYTEAAKCCKAGSFLSLL